MTINFNSYKVPINELKQIAIWSMILIFGLIILTGRYDWTPASYENSKHAYSSSAYMFILFLPTFYYTLHFFLKDSRLSIAATLAAAIIFTLPYQWLGLDAFFYAADKYYYISKSTISVDWFPGNLKSYQAIPNEGLFFLGLSATGFAIALAKWQYGVKTLSNPANRKVLTFLAIYQTILLETWLHLSLRSPLNYLGHHMKPQPNGWWYAVYLFDNLTGAMNKDVTFWRALEYLFIDPEQISSTAILRRSFVQYVTSQFSYFIHYYYTSITFNVLMWFCAVISGYLFTLRHWNERIALMAALLIASGPGFIVFVAQNNNYVTAYALYMILIYLYDEMVIQNKDNMKLTILFGGILGLSSLSYDIIPLYFYFIGYSILKKKRLRYTFIPILLSVVLYAGFMEVQTKIFNVQITHSNAAVTGLAIKKIITMIVELDFTLFYTQTIKFIGYFTQNIGSTFFIVPLLPALIGLIFLRNKTEELILVTLLLIPSFLSVAVLTFAEWQEVILASYPRFTYYSYPAIYILAAIGMERCFTIKRGTYINYLAQSIPYLLIISLYIINNLDVFGYPCHYFWFQYPLSKQCYG